MLESLIIFIIIALAVWGIVGRIRTILKGDSCAGCASDCNSCASKNFIIINDEHKEGIKHENTAN